MIEPRPFTARPYQDLMIDHIIENKRSAVWMDMGMGKTSGFLSTLDRLSFVEDVFPAIVTAPLRVANTTWPDEVEKWTDFNGLRVQPITGDLKDRKFALRNKAEIYTINYENIPWLVEELNGKWPFKTIGSDESTKLKGFRSRQGTQRAKALSSVAFKSDRFVEMTGTPSPNGLVDLWGQMWFVDQGVRLGRSFSAFSQRWFRPTWDGYGLEPLPSAQKEIEDRLRDVCLSIEAKDYFDLNEPVKTPIYVDLPPKARALYKSMEDQMYAEIEGIGVEALNAAGKTIKCQQFANGAAYTNTETREWKEVHDQKIQALESILSEHNGRPVLVAYHFKSDLARLQKAFPKGRVLDKDPKTIKDWNAGKIPVMFAHPMSCGHGLNLQDGGHVLVYFAIDWNLENHMQILERIGPMRQLQSGHNRLVFVYFILARDTVDDQLIMPRLETKRSVQDVLRDAMKRRQNVSK